MNFVDFFPQYPDITKSNFYQNLYEQKEFYDLGHAGMTGKFLNHQLIPQRFLSPWTFYQSLLLIHETGTGKSGCVAAVLNLLKKKNEFLPFIYVTNNDTLIKNFKGELLKLCPWVKDKFKSWPTDNENSFFKRYRMYFFTFGSFEKDIEKIPKSMLKDVLIVLDEAHHLVTKYMKNYNPISTFVRKIPQKKLMVLTATPMRDNAIELVYLLNLVVNTPFPTGIKFLEEYIDIENTPDGEIFRWKPGKDLQFKRHVQGFVSVFRQKIDNVSLIYHGEKLKRELFTKVFPDEMEKYQEDVYMKTWERTDTNSLNLTTNDQSNEYDTLYNHSIQSSLMVFPDGQYGSQGSKNYTISENRFNSAFVRSTTMILNPERDEDKKHNLKVLKKYSIIYYNIIKNILEAKRKKKLLYVYSEKINGSGILRCVNLLAQFFGFSIVKNSENKTSILSNPRDRLIFLNDNDIMKLIHLFNDPLNKDGDFVRVIFGTDKTTEGITLRNIREIHVVTPGWNFGKKNQAQGRGYRYGSHSDFGDKKINVDIYLHCAIPTDRNDSINLLQYVRSEIKERNIYLFMHTMLTASIDCELNYYQNFQEHGEDFSEECFLEKCDYTCDGIVKKDLTENDIQQGNYNSYFISANRNIVMEIKSLFFHNSEPKTLNDIHQQLGTKEYTLFQVFYAVMMMISKPIRIPFFDGRLFFLVQQNGYLYLTEDRHSVIWAVKYANVDSNDLSPSFRLEYTTESLFAKLCRNPEFLKSQLELWKISLKEDEKWRIVRMFQLFPVFIQKLLIEKHPSLSKLKNITLNHKTHTVQFPEDVKEEDITANTKKKEDLEKNRFGFYGMREKTSFKIRDIVNEITDKRKLSKGQFVKTIEIPRLIMYIVRIQDSITEHMKNFFPVNSETSFQQLTEMSNSDIAKHFESLQQKSKLFRDFKGSPNQIRSLCILNNLFSSRRQPLINILEYEMDKHHLFL